MHIWNIFKYKLYDADIHNVYISLDWWYWVYLFWVPLSRVGERGVFERGANVARVPTLDASKFPKA